MFDASGLEVLAAQLKGPLSRHLPCLLLVQEGWLARLAAEHDCGGKQQCFY